MDFWANLGSGSHSPVLYAVPAFLVLIAVELLSYRRDEREARPPVGRGYERRDSRASILSGLGSVVVGAPWQALTLVAYTLLYDHVAPWRLSADRWQTWVAAVLGIDLLFYAYHRLAHRVRIAWAAHQAHHSSPYFNLATALRQKWNPWVESVFWLPLPLLGIPPWMVYTVWATSLLYQFWVHTERIDRMWAPIEWVFNTPSHHRVHHGSDAAYLDRNYAGTLIVWDRLYGTYAAETVRPTYGLTKPVAHERVLALQYHEYAAIWRDVRAATTLRARLGFLIGPPGWTPPMTETHDAPPASAGRASGTATGSASGA